MHKMHGQTTYFSVAHVYKSQDFLSRKKISGLEWRSNPHTHISGVMLYQVSYQALESKLVGRKGIQVLVLGAYYYYIRNNFLQI